MIQEDFTLTFDSALESTWNVLHAHTQLALITAIMATNGHIFGILPPTTTWINIATLGSLNKPSLVFMELTAHARSMKPIIEPKKR